MGTRYALAMSRFVTDQNGKAIEDATVTVYVQETDALAEIFAAASGGSAITGSYVETDSNGIFTFFVDDDTYPLTTMFKLVISKENYETLTYQYAR